MSFKYRFILSFVLLEVFFIVLIVSVNFFTIKNSSETLIDERIKSNVTFLEQLVKVPISIYDLASLDDLVDNSSEYFNSMVILDSNDKVLSSSYRLDDMTLEQLLNIKEEKTFLEHENESHVVIFKKIKEDDVLIGSIYLVFDTTSNKQFIENNRNRTFTIIIFEILISTILSYLIGNSLTKKLTALSDLAYKIGKDTLVEIPYKNTTDEIGVLSKSMDSMQKRLITRNEKIKKYTQTLVKQKEELIE